MNKKNGQNTNMAKKMAKKVLAKATLILVGILILAILVAALYSVFEAVIEKVIDILSNAGTAIVKFWKWIRDDYWIKLDEKVENTVTNEETRARRNSRYKYS